jgi:hypothetical protein
MRKVEGFARSFLSEYDTNSRSDSSRQLLPTSGQISSSRTLAAVCVPVTLQQKQNFIAKNEE